MNIHLNSHSPAVIALLAVSLWTAQATAQTNAAALTQSVTPAAASNAAPMPYRSALDGYQPYTDEKIVDWKDANDTVGQIGGWRAYAKEASQDPSADNAVKPAFNAAPAKP